MPMQFKFEDHGPHRDEGHMGHRFRLRIALAERRGAKLAWFERSDGHEEQRQDTWVDLHGLDPAAPSFQQWLETSVDGGEIEIEFSANPSMPMRAYAQRTLELCVVVVDGLDPDDPDDDSRAWAMWRGVQQLACDGEGRPVRQELTASPPRHGRSDRAPGPDDLPHY